MKKCPCHSDLPYTKCCQPYHKGKAAPTPLALMRSRYAAYALGKIGYVAKTWHPKSPLIGKDKVAWRKGLKQFSEKTDFVGLKIIDESGDQKEATVKFNIIIFQDRRDVSYTERSSFEKINGRWLYLDSVENDGNRWKK